MQCHGAEGCAVGGWRSAALEFGGKDQQAEVRRNPFERLRASRH